MAKLLVAYHKCGWPIRQLTTAVSAYIAWSMWTWFFSSCARSFARPSSRPCCAKLQTASSVVRAMAASFQQVWLCLMLLRPNALAGGKSYGKSSWRGYNSSWGNWPGYNNRQRSFSNGNDSGSSFEAAVAVALSLQDERKKRRRPHKQQWSDEDFSSSAESSPAHGKRRSRDNKLKAELRELRSFKCKVESGKSEKEQGDRLAAIEQSLQAKLEAHLQSSRASSRDSRSGAVGNGPDCHVSGLQRRLATRLPTDVLPEQWEGSLQTIPGLDSRSLGCMLKSEGLACPRTQKERVATCSPCWRSSRLSDHSDTPAHSGWWFCSFSLSADVHALLVWPEFLVSLALAILRCI